MEQFPDLLKPPLSPPGWLFPVVWTILFLLMGYAAYRVKRSGKPAGDALEVYYLQLFFNFLWSIFFFNLDAYLLAFLWLAALWVLVFLTLRRFLRMDRIAGLLLIPYLLWVTFAGYLNFFIWVLN